MAAITSDTAIVPIEINVGETFILDFAVTEPSPTVKNLTGHTIRASVKTKFEGVELLPFTVVNGRVVETNLAGGIFRLIVSATDTALLNNNKFLDTAVWDLEIEDPGSIVVRYFEGEVTIRPEVTT